MYDRLAAAVLCPLCVNVYVDLQGPLPALAAVTITEYCSTLQLASSLCVVFLDVHRASLQPASCHHYWEHTH